jgi:integrase
MRRGELRGLRWDDVDLSTATIHVRQDKAGDGRWVTMFHREKCLASRAILPVELGAGWRLALKAAGIPDFRFHDCRHTFASRLAMASVASTPSTGRAVGRRKSWSSATLT